MFADLQDGFDDTDLYCQFLLHKLSLGGQWCPKEGLGKY